ncbi:MAG TPA: glycogen synthase GlgA [Acetobacteraceae bacterium]|nr:glycogen synthase GlgA [Acetobacteraceae bacterium]
MKALAVASEIFPLIKTGGLADVTGALPGALATEAVVVRTLLPGYPAVLEALAAAEPVLRFDDLFGGPARLLAGCAGGLKLFVIDAPHLYARPGGPYGHGDDAQRFAALGWVAAELGRGALARFAPDIVHAHDWQAGLAPAYLHYSGVRRPASVMTVHNLAFQGQFPAYLLGALRLPPAAYSIDGVEYYGSIGFLKAGLHLADRVTTVSPTYADEIRTDVGGMGMGGLLRARGNTVSGILNGIDTTVWNPAADPNLVVGFDAGRLEGRARNKAALQRNLGLVADPAALLVGMVSRLTWQKGADLLAEALAKLLAIGGQLGLLGAGEPRLEAAFTAAAAAHPGRIGVRFGYDEKLAHLIQAGADVIAVPSRFEPCGLTQLCALRYGALPLVARVGGLADTVIDANEMALAAGVATGIQFAPTTREALQAAIGRAGHLWRDPTVWRQVQHNGMASDVGWGGAARRYAAVYRSILPSESRAATLRSPP